MKSTYLPIRITRDSWAYQSTVLLDLLQDLLCDFVRLRRLGFEVAELSLQPLIAFLLNVQLGLTPGKARSHICMRAQYIHILLQVT